MLAETQLCFTPKSDVKCDFSVVANVAFLTFRFCVYVVSYLFFRDLIELCSNDNCPSKTSVHHGRLSLRRCGRNDGRNDFCPQAKWTIVVEPVYIKFTFNDYCSFSHSTAKQRLMWWFLLFYVLVFNCFAVCTLCAFS